MTHTSATEHIIAHLREAGLRVTPQRIAVYSELANAQDHPTAADLYARLRVDMPSLSQATIYNALQVMTEMGVVRELTSGEGPSRYDADLYPHAHLVCTRCGRIDDFHAAALDIPRPGDSLAEQTGYEIEAVGVFFYGRCPACRGAAQLGTGGQDE